MCVHACVHMCICEEAKEKNPRTKTPVTSICHKYCQYISTASSAIISDLKLIYTEKFYKCFRNIFTKKVYGVRIILVSHTKSMIPKMFRGTIKIFLLCWYLSISYKPANFKTSSTTTDYITGYCRSHFITGRSVTQQDADFSCFIISSFTCNKNLGCLGLVERI